MAEQIHEFVGDDFAGDVVLEDEVLTYPIRCFQNPNVTSLTAPNLTSIQSYFTFYNNSNMRYVNMPMIREIKGPQTLYSSFRDIPALTSVNLPLLETIDGSSTFYDTFRNDTGLVSVTLGSLRYIRGRSTMENCFEGCYNLANVDVRSIEEITGDNIIGTNDYENGSRQMWGMFDGCTNITSMNFSNLKTILGRNAFSYAFNDCINLRYLAFPALTAEGLGEETSQFRQMLTGLTKIGVHFQKHLKSVISKWEDYKQLFGAGNPLAVPYVRIYFDLPNNPVKDGVYYIDEVITETDAGEIIPIQILQDGYYEIHCVGSGGSGTWHQNNNGAWSGADGGSGGALVGIVYLTAGTYNVRGAVAGDGSDSFVQGVVSVGSGGNNEVGGHAPNVQKTFDSIALNKAGATYQEEKPSPTTGGQPVMVTIPWKSWYKIVYGTTAIPQEYGEGGHKLTNEDPVAASNGLVRIIFKGRDLD